MKNTVCAVRRNQAFLSPHIGDLADLRNYTFFTETAHDFMNLLEIKPEVICHDMHPDYTSTRFALSFDGVAKLAVQHHHAHLASCLAEHGLTKKVIGIALDGTGFGPDGTIWGGELMIADLKSFTRVGHFKQYPLPGAAQAILEPARMALSYLAMDLPKETESLAGRFLPSISAGHRRTLLEMMARQTHAPLTSSAGRLFDAVSVLLGFSGQVSYEGRPAICLQAMADLETDKIYDFDIEDDNGMQIISFSKTIRMIIEDLKQKINPRVIAGIFHNTVAAALVRACVLIRRRHHLSRVALSGGVFQNDLLLKKLISGLRAEGFKFYINESVPPNDGGISFGQAAVAAAQQK
jgi:hydrogenase maturation protein HypF